MSQPQPTGPEHLRVGTTERDQVIGRLREAYAEDRLTAEEFDQRVDAVLAARTHGDLRRVVADLPAERPAAAVPARQRPHWAAGHWRPRGRVFVAGAAILAVFAGVGSLSLPDAVAVMGGTTANVQPGQDEVSVLAVMGGVEVVVPDGVNVDRGGLAVMGGTDCRACELNEPGQPTVEVNAWALMGGVDIRAESQPSDDDEDD